jgi:hypothetical protein
MAITEDGSIPCTDETRADPLVCTASFPWPSITGTLAKQRVKDQIKKTAAIVTGTIRKQEHPCMKRKKTLLHYNNTQVFQTKKTKISNTGKMYHLIWTKKIPCLNARSSKKGTTTTEYRVKT